MHVSFHFFMLVALAIILPARPAFAYIDPGTGSMIFQAIIAGIVGTLFTIKMYWHVLKKKVCDLFRKKADSTEKNPESDAKD